MPGLHDLQPRVRRVLGRGYATARLVREYLRPAARNAHQPGLLELHEGLFQGQPALVDEVPDLRWRERVNLYLRELPADRAEQVGGVLHPDVRVQPALHEDAGPAEVDGLLYLFQDLLGAQYVAVAVLRLPFGPVEGAERAGDPTYVRVVDVPVYDVGDDVVRVEAATDTIRLRGEVHEVLLEELRKLLLGLPIFQAGVQHTLLQQRARCHALTLP